MITGLLLLSAKKQYIVEEDVTDVWCIR